MLNKIYSEFTAIRREFQAKRKDLDHAYSVEVSVSDRNNLVIEDIQRPLVERTMAASASAV